MSKLPIKQIIEPFFLKSEETVFDASGILPKTDIQRTGGIFMTVFPFLYVEDRESFPEITGILNAFIRFTTASTDLSSDQSDSSSGNGQI